MINKKNEEFVDCKKTNIIIIIFDALDNQKKPSKNMLSCVDLLFLKFCLV